MLSYTDNTESVMCRRCHILLMLLLPFAAAFGNVVLTKEANLPRPGDNLTLSYAGTRLTKTSDTALDLIMAGATDFADNTDADVEYTYDANGNMTSDLNKGIEAIIYNLMNLPTQISFEDGHRIYNHYDSFGNRYRTEYVLVSEDVFTPGEGEILPDEDEGETEHERVIVESRRDYCGEFIYEDGELERILTTNGCYKGGRYYFYIKDWQGNNRVTVSSTRRVDSGAGGVQLNRINANDAHAYYPYGMCITDIFTSEADAYRYGGKEFEMMNDLQWHDFSARWYDQQLCRFTTPDPLQEKYPPPLTLPLLCRQPTSLHRSHRNI